MAKTSKTSKTSTSKTSSKKPNALHDTLVKLLSRPNGATMHDTWNAGYEYPVSFALKIAERRGFKTSSKKAPGELKVYFAKR